MQANHQIYVDLWIDYVCPYSYLHAHTIERFCLVYGSNVVVRWHPFEVRPSLVSQAEIDNQARSRVWSDVIYPLAFERGVDISMPRRIASSRRAFETAHWASDGGVFDAVHRAIFDTYFRLGEDIGEIQTLVNIGQSVSHRGDALRQALESGAYSAVVSRHIDLGQRIGARGVPLTVLSRPADTSGQRHAPVLLRGVAPLSHFHMAVASLFPEGFEANEDGTASHLLAIGAERAIEFAIHGDTE